MKPKFELLQKVEYHFYNPAKPMVEKKPIPLKNKKKQTGVSYVIKSVSTVSTSATYQYEPNDKVVSVIEAIKTTNTVRIDFSRDYKPYENNSIQYQIMGFDEWIYEKQLKKSK